MDTNDAARAQTSCGHRSGQFSTLRFQLSVGYGLIAEMQCSRIGRALSLRSEVLVK
jgi:hypothetical protein